MALESKDLARVVEAFSMVVPRNMSSKASHHRRLECLSAIRQAVAQGRGSRNILSSIRKVEGSRKSKSAGLLPLVVK